MKRPDPFRMAPGPARRAVMEELGFNTTLEDFTAAELEQILATAAKIRRGGPLLPLPAKG